MNTKGGFNDKFAWGLRAPMRAYMTRINQIPYANLVFNKSLALQKGEQTCNYNCASRERPAWLGGGDGGTIGPPCSGGDD